MTRDEAEAFLCDEEISTHDTLELLDYHKPFGISIEEVIEHVVQYAQTDALDIIGKKLFGVIRQGGTFMVGSNMGASDPETDACFRDRILAHIGSKPEYGTHVHSWKLYQGFTDTYHYCSTCDEKRR